MTATTAGTLLNWSSALDQGVSGNNGCNGGANDAICSEWTAGGIGGGFGSIVNGSTLTWTFNADFAEALPTSLSEGNVRAAFNRSNGQNFNIFSPEGGSFTTAGVPTPTPEPGTWVLMGTGLTGMLGYGWRRKQRQAV